MVLAADGHNTLLIAAGCTATTTDRAQQSQENRYFHCSETCRVTVPVDAQDVGHED
jgi:hypothetical protein